MANVTIPQLPAVANITGGELLEVVQPGNAASGVSKRATVNQILTASAFIPAGVHVIAGTGLSGGGLLTADVTLSIGNTPVVAGTYGSGSAVPVLTVNAQGQLVGATTTAVTTSNIGGVPTSRQILAGTGLSGGGNLTVDRTLFLANTVVTAGTYGSASAVATFTVNAQGQLTSVVAAAITASNILAVPTSRQVLAGTGLSGGGDLTVDRSILLANTAVTAGTYGSGSVIPVLTVNPQGQVTAATVVSIAQLPNTGVTAGTYGSGSAVATFTVNAQGQLTNAVAAAITASNILAAPRSRQVLAGSGLSGGGSLATDVTLTLGAAALVLPLLGAFSSVAVQSFSSSGTYTPTTGMKSCLAFVTGPGGSGGAGGTNVSGGGSGGGGGAGETRLAAFSSSTIGVSQTVTIATPGSSTTFGALLSAQTGATGATGSGVTPGMGGIGGTGGSGGVGLPGTAGLTGTDASSLVGNGFGVAGAPSFWGGGGAGGVQGGAGANGVIGGGAGSGGGAVSSPGAGGIGGNGFVVIVEFL